MLGGGLSREGGPPLLFQMPHPLTD